MRLPNSAAKICAVILRVQARTSRRYSQVEDYLVKPAILCCCVESCKIVCQWYSCHVDRNTAKRRSVGMVDP